MEWPYKMILTNPVYFVEWQMSWVRPQSAGLDLKISKDVNSDLASVVSHYSLPLKQQTSSAKVAWNEYKNNWLEMALQKHPIVSKTTVFPEGLTRPWCISISRWL